MSYHMLDAAPNYTSQVKERYWLTFAPGEVRVLQLVGDGLHRRREDAAIAGGDTLRVERGGRAVGAGEVPLHGRPAAGRSPATTTPFEITTEPT